MVESHDRNKRRDTCAGCTRASKRGSKAKERLFAIAVNFCRPLCLADLLTDESGRQEDLRPLIVSRSVVEEWSRCRKGSSRSWLQTEGSGLSAVSIDEIIDGALEMVKFKVNLSEIEVLRNYPPELSKVNVNLAQLEEVFFNLIDNSYDAISQRKQLLKEKDYSGRITISCSGQPQDNLLSVIFADNGIGLQEKERSKVFTPFFTTKTSSRRGTGLGLFVIQRIITQLHQGRISFESEYARGTRFILELPVANGK